MVLTRNCPPAAQEDESKSVTVARSCSALVQHWMFRVCQLNSQGAVDCYTQHRCKYAVQNKSVGVVLYSGILLLQSAGIALDPMHVSDSEMISQLDTMKARNYTQLVMEVHARIQT